VGVQSELILCEHNTKLRLRPTTSARQLVVIWSSAGPAIGTRHNTSCVLSHISWVRKNKHLDPHSPRISDNTACAPLHALHCAHALCRQSAAAAWTHTHTHAHTRAHTHAHARAHTHEREKTPPDCLDCFPGNAHSHAHAHVHAHAHNTHTHPTSRRRNLAHPTSLGLGRARSIRPPCRQRPRRMCGMPTLRGAVPARAAPPPPHLPHPLTDLGTFVFK
jgi:hypothetical protein